MRTCPSCGFANADDANTCALCGRALISTQRPEEPTYAAPSSPEQPEAAAPPSSASIPPPPVSAEAPQQPTPTLAPVTTPMQPPAMPSMPPYGAAPPPPYGAPPPYPMQPAMPPPIQPPRPPVIVPHPQFSRAQWRKRFLLGLGLGMIPVVLALVSIGVLSSNASSTVGNLGIVGPIAAFVLYLATFIGMIVCLAIDRLRPIGYGLLTMVVAGPVITVASCFAIPQLVRG